MKGNVAKIAEFVGVDLSEDELEVVTERCGIEHMRKVNRFNYMLPLNTDKGLWDLDQNFILKDGKLIQSGQVGRGEYVCTFCCIV